MAAEAQQNYRMLTGLQALLNSDFASLRGRSLGVVCNQSAIDMDCVHLLDRLKPGHDRGELRVQAVFGPEHGLFGHTQDNMIEWEGVVDSRTGFTIHSLYGEHRKPTPSMLAGIDRMVVDMPDIGSRYYTFAWTMAHCLGACAEVGIPVTVLDRPNPIGGVQVEGPVLRPGFESFVGLYPVPTRHGMTLGEIASWLRDQYLPDLDLTVVPCEGWDRQQYGDETGLPWAMPSPNMPTVETAVVYPGGCLLEATNLSEGRGTTRPFETLGAPFLDGWRLADALNGLSLRGVRFRPIQFEPTFNKHAGRLCEGVFVHVTDRRAFEPVLTYVAILRECLLQTGLRETAHLPEDPIFKAASAETTLDGFAWKRPPYEYVHDRSPIDLLAGNDWLRPAIESEAPLSEIRDRMRSESERFVASTRDLRS
ncbi:DUF1343 domain-containing protein [bacterium]|nr:MAG: DUF1343 domain-containing protein [bacterium]